MANITVAQARTELLQRLKDISDVDNIPGTFLKWCNYANRYLYKELTNIVPETYIKTQAYTSVAATSSYDLPTDFQDIIPQGTGMYQIGSNGVNTDQRLTITGFASTAKGYYLNLTSIIFTPIPTETNSWNFRYIPLLTDLSGESSEFLIPARYSSYLVDALVACYFAWNEQPNDEVFNSAKVNASLAELISLINPIGQSYQTPDYSQNY